MCWYGGYARFEVLKGDGRKGELGLDLRDHWVAGEGCFGRGHGALLAANKAYAWFGSRMRGCGQIIICVVQ